MRNIYTVSAKQVVTSPDHPEGTYTNVSGYPKTFDSRNYDATDNPNGSEEIALLVAQAEFSNTVATLRQTKNRALWSVTLERASDGRQLDHKAWGAFPDMTPAPEPEEEPEE